MTPRPTDGPDGADRIVAIPVGKRALYSPSASPSPSPSPSSSAPPTPSRRGLLTVTCSDCTEKTPVGLLGFARLQFPFAAWLPRGPFDRWMTCPACRRRTWTSVTLSR